MKKLIKNATVPFLLHCNGVSCICLKKNSIRSEELWLDTDGKPIQAHGFNVFYEDGTYYWCSENQEHTTVGNNVWTY